MYLNPDMIEVPDVVVCRTETVSVVNDELRIVVHPFNGAVYHPRILGPCLEDNQLYAATWPCSPARRYHCAASGSSLSTPSPLAYMSRRMYCASASPCSASKRGCSLSVFTEPVLMVHSGSPFRVFLGCPPIRWPILPRPQVSMAIENCTLFGRSGSELMAAAGPPPRVWRRTQGAERSEVGTQPIGRLPWAELISPCARPACPRRIAAGSDVRASGSCCPGC